MTNAELIAKIKAEIERRREANKRQYHSSAGGMSWQRMCGEEDCLVELLSFLSTLESEKPVNPEDAMKELDEKIALVKQRGTWDGVDVDKYMDEVRGREPEKPVPNDLEEAKEAYCEEHNDDCFDATGDKCPHIRNAFIAGAKWDRSQMMQEAVEGVVCYGSKGAYIETDFLGEYNTDVYGNSGDKVRVIVCKKED